MKRFKSPRNISFTFLLPIFFLVGKTRIVRWAMVSFLLLALAGCFQYYYKTNTRDNISGLEIQKLQAANKYFIVHFADTAIALINISANKEQIEGNMVELLPEHKKYLNPDKLTAVSQTTRFSPKRSHYRVKAKDRFQTLTEVHLYTSEKIQRDKTTVSLPFTSFNRIDVYELDRNATTSNHILSVVGGVLVVGSAVTLIAFLIACNCPQVYVENNGQYEFVSGIYSGAVYSSLERPDYLPLDFSDSPDKTLKLKIRNVKDEEQFINCMQLMQVSHPVGSEVLTDRHGKVFSYKEPTAPVVATVNNKKDVKKLMLDVDDQQYLFDSEKDKNGLSSVELTFKKPVGATKAKLIVHAGNSNWSGYLYHSFAELFGSSYEKWKAEKDKSDPIEMEKWQTDQGLPLMVYVERNGKWDFADYFAHTGNTASRDMIMELDVGDIQTDRVRVKLETVYQFWNLDFAAVDFSSNDAITAAVVNPTKAVKTDGSNQTDYLSGADNSYAYLKPEEEINLEYETTSQDNKGQVNSYFLVSTGYYHSVKKYEGPPKIAKLLEFKKTNAFDNYSREKFAEVQKQLNSYAIQKH